MGSQASTSHLPAALMPAGLGTRETGEEMWGNAWFFLKNSPSGSRLLGCVHVCGCGVCMSVNVYDSLCCVMCVWCVHVWSVGCACVYIYDSMCCVTCVYVCGVGVCAFASGRFACVTIYFSTAQKWIEGSCWWERPVTPFGATSPVSLLLTSALDPLMLIMAALAGTPRTYSASALSP